MLFINNFNDRFFKKYKKLFNYDWKKFEIVSEYLFLIMYNPNINNKNQICNFVSSNKENYFKLDIFKDVDKKELNIQSFNQYHKIIKNNSNKLNNNLCITNISSIIYKIVNEKDLNNTNISLFPNTNFTEYDLKIKEKLYLPYIDRISGSHDVNIYRQFIENIKNNKQNKNYNFININNGFRYGLHFSASYNMLLQLPYIISSLGVAFKSLEKDGTLLLFWTIINIYVPSVQKILTLLSFAFETVQVITDDINQNFFQGIPEYYIKCTGYKANLSDQLINALLDISLKTIDYSYDICDIIDYYEKYSRENPNQTLFYKNSNTELPKKTSSRINSKKTSKKSKTLKSSIRISDFLASSRKTKQYSSTSKKSKFQKEIKDIKDIKYIEDFDLPDFDIIQNEPETQFKTMILSNKLETIFIECFEKINNMIINQTEINDKGELQVKPYAIAQRKVNDIKRFVNMLETNNIPYNKHILTIMKEQEDELINNFYNLDNTINTTLIKYNDKHSKGLIRNAFTNFRLCSGYTIDIILNYFESINLAYRVKENLLESLGLGRAPRIVQRAFEDFTRGLKDYITARYAAKLPHREVSNAFVKMWECLTVFDLIPKGIKTNKYRVLHICEAPGQMILACKYFVQQKRKNITDYDWRANSLNPFNKALQQDYENKIFGDNYGLIKGNPGKWLWGADNTGDITTVKNIKWFREYVQNKYLKDGEKLDLIVGDGGLSTDNDPLLLQKLDLAQVVMVLACSSRGGSCVIKHFTPYIKRHTDTYNAIGFFIGFLYMYYVAFDEVSLLKPYSSNPDSGEFYVVGQGFNGIDEEQLERLYKMLYKFELNDGLIPKEFLPETFVSQISIFLEKMSNLNTMSIEKQNLLLTCYKDGKNPKVGKYLKCDRFMDEDNLQTILVPRYNAWIKKYQFT